jgi:hypothetical protein
MNFIQVREDKERTVMRVFASAVVAALLLDGCATTSTDGVVQVGTNQYMIGGLGKFTDFSSSAVKARFYQKGAKFCADKGLVMSPVTSTGQDSGLGTYASAEIHFRCVPRQN